MERNGQSELSLTSALERVLGASQRVVLDRIDLLKLEAEEDLVHSFQGAKWVALGAVLLIGSWIFLMALAVHWLDGIVSHAASLGIVVLCQAVPGAVISIYGIQALRRIRLLRPDEEQPGYSTPAASIRTH